MMDMVNIIQCQVGVDVTTFVNVMTSGGSQCFDNTVGVVSCCRVCMWTVDQFCF